MYAHYRKYRKCRKVEKESQFTSHSSIKRQLTFDQFGVVLLSKNFNFMEFVAIVATNSFIVGRQGPLHSLKLHNLPM